MTTIVEPLTRTASVREVTIDLLRALGMTTVFGNPGSTELRFMKDWPTDFRYVMALHEMCSVAMADAYAQFSGDAALVMLHSAGGVGNAMGTIYTAYRNNAPLVILAGQQTRAMLPTEPFLYAKDAAEFPRPYVKWSVEPARAQDVPAAIARAYYIATQRPYGPAFVSIPEDDWDREVAALGVRRIYADFCASDAALDELAAAFAEARRPAIVVGAGVDRDGADALVVELAERCGAAVYSSALTHRCSFPERHPLFAGALPRIRSGAYDKLRGHDLIVVLGAPVFTYHIHAEGPHVNEGAKLYQLTDDPSAASYAAVGTSVITALQPALARLIPRVSPAPRAVAAVAHERSRVAPADPISIEYLLQTLAETLPDDALIAEEAPSTHAILHEYFPLRPGSYFAAASGSLGYGLPAAVGLALAAPGRRVVAMIGDGSSYYAIQALWTAAELALPITFVIVNNGGYGAMNSFVKLLGSTRSPSFAIGNVDIASIASGFGCEGRRVERSADLEPALRESFASSRPIVVDVAVESAAKKLF